MLKLIIVWGLAALFFADSLYVTITTDFTAGTALMWCATLLLTLYGIFYRRVDAFCMQGFGRVLKYSFVAGLLIFSLLFLFVAVGGYTNTVQYNEEAIIVLGAGIRGEEVGDMLRRRLNAAIEAHEDNPSALIVVSGGKGTDEKIPEALAMQRYLLQQGIPEEMILMEDQSTSTQENLEFSRQLLAQHGISEDAPVAVVTNAFHCYRAREYAKMAGFTDVRTLPASMNPWVILPAYMREVLAILFLWIFKR